MGKKEKSYSKELESLKFDQMYVISYSNTTDEKNDEEHSEQ